ncbi:hypothetical protein N9L06_07490 [Mariniblastus sp.]|nr:hypothetical protein [Mariniblastus sp.]
MKNSITPTNERDAIDAEPPETSSLLSVWTGLVIDIMLLKSVGNVTYRLQKPSQSVIQQCGSDTKCVWVVEYADGSTSTTAVQLDRVTDPRIR